MNTTSVGNRTLATNTYNVNNGNLQMLTYGNGDFISYIYDNFGNIVSMAKNNTIAVKNYTNANGDIIRSVDKLSNLEHRVNFDTTGRLISKDVYDLTVTGRGDKWLRSLEYDYDLNNNLTRLSYSDSKDTSITTKYEYNADNYLSKTTLDNTKTVTYYRDALGRVTATRLNTTNRIDSGYTYVASDVYTGYTTTYIQTETSNAFAYKYVYDPDGNITAIQNGTKQSDGSYIYSNSTGHKYTYDQYNQLVTDIDLNNNSATYYTYDTNGNITQKLVRDWNAEDNYPMGVTYARVYKYEDTNGRGDLLTSWGGQTFTYDEIGNPLTYRDGITMTWNNGRELKSLSQNGKTLNFTYDPNGLRTKKSITSSTGSTTNVEYIYEGGLLMQMTYGERIFDFIYDASGNPMGFKYTIPSASVSSYYYYGLNSRGDIEALYTSTGSISALYEYDAYGQLLSVKNSSGAEITGDYSLAHLNPLRYRGYVYDSETGLYYLQSRYYDPTTCRFINADAIATTTNGLNGLNLFAYCSNNPIMYSDPSGYCPVYIPSCPVCNHDLADLHEERGPDWATKGVYIKPTSTEPSFFEKCGQSIEVLYNSAFIDVGCGYGIGGSIGVGNLSIDGVINSDLVHVKFSSDGAEFGMDCNISFGPSIYGKSIPILSYYDNYFQSYVTGLDNEIYEIPNDFVIVDLSTYCIIGITFVGGWDGQKISNGLANIWGF